MAKLIVGITGGIASGKSQVAENLANSKFVTIDADIVARKVVEKGSECLNCLVKEFGVQILNSDNTLNRSKLKHLVFNSPQKIEKLNQITHPHIGQEITRQINSTQNDIFLVIPLLTNEMIEKYSINRVLVVDVGLAIQLERVMKRDGLESNLAKKMIKSQVSRRKRLEMASDVVVNNGSLEKLNKNCKLMLSTLGV